MFKIQIPGRAANYYNTDTHVEVNPECDENRVYVTVDDTFDISIRRVEGSIIIDVYGGVDFMDLIDTLEVADSQIVTPEQVDRQEGEAACGSSGSRTKNTAPGTTSAKPRPTPSA